MKKEHTDRTSGFWIAIEAKSRQALLQALAGAADWGPTVPKPIALLPAITAHHRRLPQMV